MKEPTMEEIRKLVTFKRDDNGTLQVENVRCVVGDVGNVFGNVRGNIHGNIHGNVGGSVHYVGGTVRDGVCGDVGCVGGDVGDVGGDVGYVYGKILNK